MITFNVNSIMDQLIKGEISKKQAVDMTTNFVCRNYKVFGLDKYDEDLRSEIYLALIEKGESFLDSYRPEIGDYFSYLFTFINTQKLTKLKTLARNNVKEAFVIQNGPLYLAEKEFSYSKSDFKQVSSNLKNRPLPYRPIPAEEVRRTLTRITKKNKNKKIIILALKTCFYLTDEHMEELSRIYNIPLEDLQGIIQFFKEQLLDKAEKKQRIQERRNYAYFNKKKYENQMNLVKKSDRHYNNIFLLQELEVLLFRNQKRFISLNNKLKEGWMLVRPTNKMIADYLGICERQVIYFLGCCRE